MDQTGNNDSCQNCKFWLEGQLKLGTCRRYPPSFPGFEDYPYVSPLPTTRITFWCGEHKPGKPATE